MFTQCAGNLKNRVKSELENSGGKIVAFLDVQVCNQDAYTMYNELKRLAVRNHRRLLCLPIRCSEYYFIRVVDDKLIVDEDNVIVARSMLYYLNSRLAYSNKSKRKSFEGFCKGVMSNSFRPCVSRGKWEYSGCMYFEDECADNDCELNYSYRDKALSVAKEFPILPDEFGWELHSCTDENLYAAHCGLVELYNDTCRRFNEIDSELTCVPIGRFPKW